MNGVRALLPGVALLALTACGPSDERCARLDLHLRYCLQPTQATAPMDQRQQLVLAMDGRQHTLLVDLQVDAKGQQMVLLTPLGQTVAQLNFDNQVARRQGPPLPWPEQLSPAVLLGLVQMAWWPAEQVQAGLDAGWTVRESPGTRQLVPHSDQAPWLDIRYDPPQGPPRRIGIHLPKRNVHLDIEVLEPEAASP